MIRTLLKWFFHKSSPPKQLVILHSRSWWATSRLAVAHCVNQLLNNRNNMYPAWDQSKQGVYLKWDFIFLCSGSKRGWGRPVSAPQWLSQNCWSHSLLMADNYLTSQLKVISDHKTSTSCCCSTALARKAQACTARGSLSWKPTSDQLSHRQQPLWRSGRASYLSEREKANSSTSLLLASWRMSLLLLLLLQDFKSLPIYPKPLFWGSLCQFMRNTKHTYSMLQNLWSNFTWMKAGRINLLKLICFVFWLCLFS